MANSRTPTALKVLKGSFRTSPERRLEPMPTDPLGNSPKYFAEDERSLWNEIRRISCKGVLFESDRLVVEMTSLIMAKVRRREVLTPSESNMLKSNLSMLGMTPADRTRIQVQPADDKPKRNFDFLG